MKFFTALIYFVMLTGAIAQSRIAPLPSFIIIYGSNQPGSVVITHISAASWKEDFVKQQSVITNLSLTCISAKSLAATRTKEGILLVLHDATRYGPGVVDGKYGGDQKLQTIAASELSISLRKTQLLQVNDEIINADELALKFKTIP
jgi:hypothetical protein